MFESAVKNATRIEVDVARAAFDNEQPDREKGGEDDAHGGSSFDFAELGDPLGEERGENSRESGPEEHPKAGTRS